MACSVLIVDDNARFLDAARTLLVQQGLKVVGVASTAAEARGRAAELRPDVVLVDIMLGGESGFELARRLRRRARGGSAVILTSTHEPADFADLIDESPADGFVAKAELSAIAIQRILDAARAAESSVRPER
jgi:DNA-binding NarL/FixJ family response regulator